MAKKKKLQNAPEKNYLKDVRSQYENLPYPPKDPEVEKKALSATSLDRLDQINYYCFEGKENFENNFNVLVAGGGTGDATVFLAEQLRHTNATIYHVDLSSASIAVAKKRIQNRRLTNVTFIHDSLLNLPDLGIGPFDYINCSGVLHHLESPEDGLNALKFALKPTGAMAIMVYGQYGRTGIYQLQELLQKINHSASDLQEKIDNTKKILKQPIPNNHPFFLLNNTITDHRTMGDSGIYDLLLHSQDRAYTVPQLYDWIEGCDMHLQTLIRQHKTGSIHYTPAVLFGDPDIIKAINELPLKEQQHIAELYASDVKKHCMYVTPKLKALPDLDNLELIPFFSTKFMSSAGALASLQKSLEQNGQTIATQAHRCAAGFTRKTHSEELVNALIDGTKPLKVIYKEIIASSSNQPSIKAIHQEFKAIFKSFELVDWILLREAHVPKATPLRDLQKRVTDIYAKPTKKKKHA